MFKSFHTNNKLLEMVSKGDNSSNLEIIEMICCLLKWVSNTTFYVVVQEPEKPRKKTINPLFQQKSFSKYALNTS